MKKRIKKLSLSRETVRHLQADRFRQIAGAGGETYERQTGCACTDTCYCGTGTCSGSCGCATINYGCTSETYERLSGCATNC